MDYAGGAYWSSDFLICRTQANKLGLKAKTKAKLVISKRKRPGYRKAYFDGDRVCIEGTRNWQDITAPAYNLLIDTEITCRGGDVATFYFKLS